MLVYFKNNVISWRGLPRRLFLFGFALFMVTGNLLAADVKLAWDASTAANLGGYKVYYGQSSRNYAESVDVGKSTSYSVPRLQAGATYYFAVSAYDLTKTVDSGYSDEASATVPMSPPTVGFTPSQTSGNASLTVIFTPATTGDITNWQWDFGDGTTNAGTASTVPTEIKSYGSAGIYTVSLTVTGPSGSVTQAKSNLITVIAPPPPPPPPPASQGPPSWQPCCFCQAVIA